MRISEILSDQSCVFSFEFFPPKSQEAADQLEQTIAELRPLEPNFVSVTYGAGGSTREKTIDIVSRIKRETGIEAMAHLTCVGSTRDELRSVVGRLVAAGVENILALRGDPPKGQTAFVATEGGFSYANELVAFLRDEYGSRLCIGAAAYPEKHVECNNPFVDLNNLKRKVESGVSFLVTQLFFDNRRYFDFVENARAHGVTVPVVPGIMPITNASQIERFTMMCGATLPYKLAHDLDRHRDDLKATFEIGVEFARTQCAELLRNGAPGIHFYTLNKSTATTEVFAGLREEGFARTAALA